MTTRLTYGGSYHGLRKRRIYGRSTWGGPERCAFSSSSTSRTFPHLNVPTAHDAHELWLRMQSRPSSLITTLLSGSGSTDNDSVSGHVHRRLQRYTQDWTRNERWSNRGNSQLVVRPQTAEEVARVLEYCDDRRIGVVPQGGNTGLVGGSIPVADEIILSLEHMNRILTSTTNVDDAINDRVLRAEAGCVLQDLQEFAASKMNALVPVDLGAKGTCQIGGNLSTNAGGVYYYRYGSLHANVIGLEVAVPPVSKKDQQQNQILTLGYHPTTVHLKDNTGYDLKHLFIGAEGTLGVITKVALSCPPLPISIQAVWLTAKSLDHVLRIQASAQTRYLNEILAAFEFMDAGILELVQETHAGSSVLNDVIYDGSSNYSVLIETHGSNQEHDQDKLQEFLEFVMDQGLVVNGVMAQSLSQVQEFWKVREVCNPAAAATGRVYKYDVSLAVAEFGPFIQEIKQRLADYGKGKKASKKASTHLKCVNWGHIIGTFHGYKPILSPLATFSDLILAYFYEDGNLHCNVVTPNVFEEDAELLHYIENCIFDAVMKRNGSISAEHGLGQYKNEKLLKIKDPSSLQCMYSIKNVFDPHGILNPGKYLPSTAH